MSASARCPQSFTCVSFCLLLVSLLVGHCVRLVSLLSFFVCGLVSFLVGHCVRLVSFLSPFGPPSCWTLCLLPVCSPFLLVTVSVLSFFCFLLFPFLSPFLLVIVSLLVFVLVFLSSCLPFLLAFLFPFLMVIASALSQFCVPLSLVLSPLLWSLCPSSCPGSVLALLASLAMQRFNSFVSKVISSLFHQTVLNACQEGPPCCGTACPTSVGLVTLSLLVGHCVRLVSLLSPFVSPITVSALSPFCLPLSPFLSLFLLVIVSAALSLVLSPFLLVTVSALCLSSRKLAKLAGVTLAIARFLSIGFKS